MKAKRSCSLMALTVVVGTAMSFMGVAVAQPLSSGDKDGYYGVRGGATFRPSQPAAKAVEPAKPAPAKAAEPAPAPKAAPAPAATGNCRTFRPAVPAGGKLASLAFPTGDVNTSALLVQRVSPGQVRVGQDYIDEIHVTNVTGGDLQNVMVTLSGFDNYTVKSSTPAAMSGGAAGTITWGLGTIKSCETQVIRVTGASQKTGNTSSCLSATYSSTLCMGTTVVEPALQITKTMPAVVTTCDPIPVTITVRNAGTGNAENVKISDPLPQGLTVDGKQTWEQVIGTLAAGQSREVKFTAKAAGRGKFDNSARAMADGGLTAASSNVSVQVTQPAVEVALVCEGTRLIGQNATVKLTVKNTGDAVCNPAVVNVTVPAGLANVAGEGLTFAGGRATITVPNLAPGQSREVTFTGRTGAAGSLALAAEAVCSNCPQPAAKANCTIQVQGVPDIGTSISDNDGVRQVGENHVFTYTVENQGQIPLTGVTVNATLTEGASFVSSTAATQPTVNGRNLVFNVGTVPVGQKVSFTITVKGDRAGEMGIDTETRSNELKRTVRNDEQVTYVNR